MKFCVYNYTEIRNSLIRGTRARNQAMARLTRGCFHEKSKSLFPQHRDYHHQHGEIHYASAKICDCGGDGANRRNSISLVLGAHAAGSPTINKNHSMMDSISIIATLRRKCNCCIYISGFGTPRSECAPAYKN